jgi:Ran GTPase-activating protein (RanGAP) involved in mRNA processing and transport
MLKLHTKVVELDFSGNDLRGKEAAMGLGEILSSSPLQALVLKGCYLGDIGVSAISKALYGNSHLAHLDVSLNRVTNQGMSELLKATQKSKSLATLNLSGNAINSNEIKQLSSFLIEADRIASFSFASKKFSGIFQCFQNQLEAFL